MTLPKQIRIGLYNYKVVHRSNIRDGKLRLCGQIRYDSLQIHILNADMPDYRQNEALINTLSQPDKKNPL